MKAEKSELIQQTFAKVEVDGDGFTARFYQRLFELDPSLRPMFKSDLPKQASKLMATLRLAVRGLSNVQSIVPALRHLGRRHVAYGVTDSQYDTVREALLDTLALRLGDDFTEEVRSTWHDIYEFMADIMKDAVREARGEDLDEFARAQKANS
jgi:hemoglobin-like flavoprotein